MKRFTTLVAFLASFAQAGLFAQAPVPAPLPVVGVSASDPTAFKNLSSGAFTVYRDGTNGELVVHLKISGTASNGVDIVKLPDTVTIPTGFHAAGLAVQTLATGQNILGEYVQLTVETNAAYTVKHGSAKVEVRADAFENDAPSVAISAPVAGAGFVANSNIPVAATVDDADGNLKKVSIFANDKLLGSFTEAPYTLVWSNVTAGKYALFVRAEDTLGKSTLSSPVHISVTNITPVSKLTLSTPANKSVFGAPASITLEATAGTNQAVIKSVSFYADDSLVGTVTASPFALLWGNVQPGKYTLIAKATENSGAISVSQKVRITVTNTPPKVAITAPAENAQFGLPGSITITADASPSIGALSSVMFFSDDRFLGTVKTAPYSLVWSNAAPGKHTLTAKAADEFGTAALSAPVHIVATNPLPVLKWVAPTNGASFTSPATVKLEVEATDADGIRSVTFWNGKHALGTVKKAPYALTLNKVNHGTYTFSASATDALGQTVTLSPISVTVQKR